jgi:hypothetical protein
MISTLLTIVTILTLSIPATLMAAKDEGLASKLISPGPLSEGHKNLETTGCLDCHKIGTGVPDKNCLECHEEIKNFKEQKLGFHGNQKKNCISCHKEHKGRKFNRTNLNQKKFDHSLTTFELKGEHKKLECKECHTDSHNKKKNKRNKIRFFRELKNRKTTCFECHIDETPHTFSDKYKEENCALCHINDSWDKIREFDHDKTNFKLIGKHKELTCKECHVPLEGKSKKRDTKKSIYNFKGLATLNCLTCHEDKHKFQGARLKNLKDTTDCSTCHSNDSFKTGNKFNHNTMTNFKLEGKHAAKSCNDCHQVKAKMKYTWNNDNCSNCHDTPHKDQFTAKLNRQDCRECHTTESFIKRKKFDHSQTKTDIGINHTGISCSKCHKPAKPKKLRQFSKRPMRQFKFPNKDLNSCASCHEDPHKGSFGPNCSSCHMGRDWKISKNYHKEFKLKGIHLALSCKECHTDNKHLGGTSDQCIQCHQKDDVHYGSLPDCADCHTQNVWESTKFSHSLTGFPLIGKHRTLECINCHTNGTYAGTPEDCSSCHLQDALNATSRIHTMPTYMDCAKCHNQFSF